MPPPQAVVTLTLKAAYFSAVRDQIWVMFEISAALNVAAPSIVYAGVTPGVWVDTPPQLPVKLNPP